MSIADAVPAFWEMLTQDVALWGRVHSPLLSWLGAFGIILFCVWHLRCLCRSVASARRTYARVWPLLSRLADERRQVDQEWLTVRAFADTTQDLSRRANPRPTRIDLDDVHALDAAIRQEPLFERAWMQFRKTYVLEHTSWFVEPRVFSTKPAADYFPADGLLAGRLNITFYHQLPSMMTGLGLLFTFLAILIGLSRLHAEGGQIVGIQGLINGVAGKFVTSVVGLVCANIFVMLEKSWTFGLTRFHHRFLTVLDELFPRLTMEQLLENRTAAGSASGGGVTLPHAELAERLGMTVCDSLAPSVSALATALQGFVQRVHPDQSIGQARTVAEVALGSAMGWRHPSRTSNALLRSSPARSGISGVPRSERSNNWRSWRVASRSISAMLPMRSLRTYRTGWVPA